MGVPIGSVHHAHASAAVSANYTCAHCGRRFVVRAVGESRGEAVSPLFVAERSAAEAAQRRAADYAQSDAHENVRIAPCPSCGRRQPGIVLRFWGLWGFIVALPWMALPFVSGLAWLLYGGWQATLAGAVLVIGSGLAFRAAHRKWTSTHATVHFEPVASSTAAPVSHEAAGPPPPATP